VIPYDERVGRTHMVTMWQTGLEVIGFMAYERCKHFLRSRVVDQSRRTIPTNLTAVPPAAKDDKPIAK
jgi:hypothetical protein